MDKGLSYTDAYYEGGHYMPPTYVGDTSEFDEMKGRDSAEVIAAIRRKAISDTSQAGAMTGHGVIINSHRQRVLGSLDEKAPLLFVSEQLLRSAIYMAIFRELIEGSPMQMANHIWKQRNFTGECQVDEHEVAELFGDAASALKDEMFTRLERLNDPDDLDTLVDMSEDRIVLLFLCKLRVDAYGLMGNLLARRLPVNEAIMTDASTQRQTIQSMVTLAMSDLKQFDGFNRRWRDIFDDIAEEAERRLEAARQVAKAEG